MSLRPLTVKEFSDWLMILADQIHRINLKEGNDRKKKARILHVSDFQKTCYVCDGSHVLANCVEFAKLSYDERWAVVKKRNVCFACLKSGHRIAGCFSKNVCGIDNCKAMHNQSLQNESVKRAMNPDAAVFKPPTILNCQDRSLCVLFKILPVNISGPKGVVQTFAFLDDGSSITLMNRDVADKIRGKRS